MAQWLRFRAPQAGGPGSIPGQGTISHMPQLRPTGAKKINKNKYFFKKTTTLLEKQKKTVRKATDLSQT